MPAAVAKPVRVRVHDVELATDLVRVVAYAGACPCGWVGPSRKVYAQAQADAREHNATHREKGPDAA